MGSRKGLIEQNILVHVMTEGRLAWRTPSVTLEVGLGLGVVLLGMSIRGGNCDGTCKAGGAHRVAHAEAHDPFRDGRIVAHHRVTDMAELMRRLSAAA